MAPLARGMKRGPEVAHGEQGAWYTSVAGCRLRMGANVKMFVQSVFFS
jgi:hypothetical protein